MVKTLDDIPDTPCGNAFRKSMKGRQYGCEALTTAWSWFQDGWHSDNRKYLEARRNRIIEAGRKSKIILRDAGFTEEEVSRLITIPYLEDFS